MFKIKLPGKKTNGGCKIMRPVQKQGQEDISLGRTIVILAAVSIAMGFIHLLRNKEDDGRREEGTL